MLQGVHDEIGAEDLGIAGLHGDLARLFGASHPEGNLLPVRREGAAGRRRAHGGFRSVTSTCSSGASSSRARASMRLARSSMRSVSISRPSRPASYCFGRSRFIDTVASWTSERRWMSSFMGGVCGELALALERLAQALDQLFNRDSRWGQFGGAQTSPGNEVPGVGRDPAGDGGKLLERREAAAKEPYEDHSGARQ